MKVTNYCRYCRQGISHLLSIVIFLFTLFGLTATPAWSANPALADFNTYELNDSRWAMLTVPADASASDIQSLFGDDLDIDDYGFGWIIYLFDASTQAFNTVGLTETLNPGDAFWIYQRTGSSVVIDIPTDLPDATRVFSDACPVAAGCYEKVLESPADGGGFDLVGSPFPMQTALGTISLLFSNTGTSCDQGCTLAQAADLQLIGNVLFSYDSASGSYQSLQVNSTDDLLPWQGFWIAMRTREAGQNARILFPANELPDEPIDDEPVENPPEVSGRIQANDIQLLGSFRVPRQDSGNEDNLDYGGTAMAYNAVNESLFLVGHAHHQRSAEITIAEASVAGSIDQLPVAQFVQTPTDATAGRLPDISNPASPEYAEIGGQFVIDNRLIVSAFHYYDAADSQVASHFARSTNLSNQANIVGPVSLSSSIKPRWLGGPMALIPEQWQGAFGHNLLGGLGGIPIVSNSSAGPAAAAFSIDSIDGNNQAKLLLGYPLERALDGPETTSTLWNLTSEVRGIVFPEGSSSVLFFGRHGVGTYCYGTGPQCNDSIDTAQGTHAPPYRYQVWAYAAEDLLAVADGSRESWSIQPYSVWELELPFSTLQRRIGGVAYDPATQRIFISQREADENRYPLIHIFSLSTDEP